MSCIENYSEENDDEISESEDFENGDGDQEVISDPDSIELYQEDSEQSSDESSDNTSDVESEAEGDGTRTVESNGYTFEISESGTTTARGEAKIDPSSRKGMNSIHPTVMIRPRIKGIWSPQKKEVPRKRITFTRRTQT